MFKDFDRRLERDIKRLVNARHKLNSVLTEGSVAPQPIEVRVISHQKQRYAVWLGGSLFAATADFHKSCHTKKKYEEYGPCICRYNSITDVMV